MIIIIINSGATLLCVGYFFQKYCFTPCGEKKLIMSSQNLKLT